MKAQAVRTGKPMTLADPQFFFAQDRALADEAFAGDVVGIPNHGTLRIGDTLTEGEDIDFPGVPSFAPEILRRVRLGDPMKAKKLKQALQETGRGGRGAGVPPARRLAGDRRRRRPAAARRAEGAARREYGLPVDFESANSSWRAGLPRTTRRSSTTFVTANRSDRRGPRRRPGVPGKNQFYLDYTRERAPGIAFTDIKDVKKDEAAV